MGTPQREVDPLCTFTVDFTELPKLVKITSECFNGDTKSIEVSEACKIFTNQLIAAFSLLPSCSITLPKVFFDQNNDIYQKHIQGFLDVLRLCLLSQSGLNISERSDKTEDDLLAKSAVVAVPYGSDDTNGYNTNCMHY